MPVQNSSTDFQMARAQQCSRKRARVRQNCIFLPRFRGSIRQTFLLSNPSKRSNTTNHDRSAVQNRFDLLDRDKKKKEEKKDIADKCNSRGTLCNLKRLKKDKKKARKNFQRILIIGASETSFLSFLFFFSYSLNKFYFLCRVD